MQTNREIWADIVRILATFLIILVHTSGIYRTSQINYISSLTYSTLGYLGAPLFLIISGYFLLNKKETIKIFFRKRFNRILLPWISWSLILSAIQIYQSNSYSISIFISEFKKSLQAFWFLPLLFCLYLLTPFLRNLLQNSSKNEVFLMLIAWFLAFSFFPYSLNSQAFPYAADNGLVRQTFGFIGFYIFGYYLFLISKEKIDRYFYLIAFVILGVSTIIFANLVEIKHLNLQIIHYFSPTIVLAAMALTLFLFTFLKRIRFPNKARKIITQISSMSLGIYLLHDVILSKIIKGYVFVSPDNFYAGLINATLIMLISIFILFVVEKIPVLKKLLI